MGFAVEALEFEHASFVPDPVDFSGTKSTEALSHINNEKSNTII